METYNASKDINSADWLALDEATRLCLVEEYIENFEKRIDSSKLKIHAVAHMVVENQLALGEKPTLDAYARLMRQGLNRHETIHAIGAVILEDLYDVIKAEGDISTNAYKNRLRKLTAKKWLKGKY